MNNNDLDALLGRLSSNHLYVSDMTLAAAAIRELRTECEESHSLAAEHIAENDEYGASISAARRELTALKGKYCPEEMTNEQKSSWIDMQWEAANPHLLSPERKAWLAKIDGYAVRLRPRTSRADTPS